MLGVEPGPAHPESAFRHEAMLYAGEDEFVANVSAFVGEGLDAHEPTFVFVDAHKIRLLQLALGSSARYVQFANMRELGDNPARILPEWRSFVDEHAPDDRLRGVGEPIWAGRSDAELAECLLHESLLNLAFAEGISLHLMCPYDVNDLDDQLIDGARHTHPFVDGAHGEYDAGMGVADRLAEPLPQPFAEPAMFRFSSGPLHDFRQFVAKYAARAGLRDVRLDDIVLAANEIASNSILHGGGGGLVKTWADGPTFLCDIHDAGHVSNPLVGRLTPGRDAVDGRGIWMANQLCDLVQVRSSERGTVVRLHMRTDRAL